MITPTGPTGCHVSISRWPGRSDAIVQPVQLARQADGELADVDHLLDLAEAFGADLAGLDRDQLAELGLVLTEQLTEPAHELPRTGAGVSRQTWNACSARPTASIHVSWRVSGQPAELTPGDRCAGRDGAVLVQFQLGAATPQGGQRSPRSDSVVGRVVMIVR